MGIGSTGPSWSGGRAGLRLRDACSVKHDGDLEALLASKRELKGLVDQVMRGCRFRGRRIVTHPPGEHLRLMVLNYTADESVSEAQQVMDLCRERMRSDLLDHVVDFVRIRTSGQQQGDRSVLVAAAPEEPVLEHLERLRRAGLEVEAMEIAPMAVRRLIAAIAPDPADLKSGEIALVLRMRAASTEAHASVGTTPAPLPGDRDRDRCDHPGRREGARQRARSSPGPARALRRRPRRRTGPGRGSPRLRRSEALSRATAARSVERFATSCDPVCVP